MRRKQPKLSYEQRVQKAEELGNSRPLDVWRISKYPQVKGVIDILFKEMEDKGLVSKRYAPQLRKNLTVLVLNLYVAFLTDPTSYIAYYRRKEEYQKGSRYKALFISYSHMINSADFLLDNGYAAGTKGSEITSKVSRIRATQKLISLFEQEKVTPEMVERDKDAPEEPLIVLRNENRESIDFEETDETRRMTETLKVINKALKEWAILLYVTDEELQQINDRMKKNPDPGKRGPIDFSNKRLRRIFNNSRWDHGGRFFGGWWQNVPREYRVNIRLDEKHVVECDYSGLHINMLYAMEKLPIPKGDVYHLDGYSNDQTFRGFVKQLLLIMVNAETRDKARDAIHSAVHREKVLELPPEIPSTKWEHLFPVMDAFERKHEAIKHHFCTGIGISLQNLDSQIAEKVLLKFSKHGYAVLPLHDSFIIHHGEEKNLLNAMRKAFFEVMGCKTMIDVKYNSLEDWRRGREPLPMPRNKEEWEKWEKLQPRLKDALAAQVPYSTYYRLLNEHWKKKYGWDDKNPEPDPVPPW
jgi:hypothetical protein